MLEEHSPGMNHSKSSQTSSCCIFLYKGIATTSGSGYCKAVNSCTLEECIRNITTCYHAPCIFLQVFACWLLLLGMLNGLVSHFYKSREQKSSCWISDLLWWITMGRCTGRSKSKINTHDNNLHSPLLFSSFEARNNFCVFFRRNLKMKCQRYKNMKCISMQPSD